ncbi:MarR family winged helix-turn-helix transcriptional regulator [Thalassotalea sediminis]|uniref:MarR family winged helix-turn-helix transcriptional regulator n=1 Tax=Thalassotalea sediminis TaxID=1759089 RepID=UPI002574363B|nr:MarR family transcriptional regulator [Thalassotalea sediminis]
MNTNQFTLTSFFPYQLARLQMLVSQSIAQVYQGEFELSRQQWRVLAILATHAPINAKQVGLHADLDKMPTSRAIKGLIAQKLVNKKQDKDDKRVHLLSLSKTGINLFERLIPIVKQQEQALLSVLSDEEKMSLDNAMKKLVMQSERLTKNET